jgi:hypothetical protein
MYPSIPFWFRLFVLSHRKNLPPLPRNLCGRAEPMKKQVRRGLLYCSTSFYGIHATLLVCRIPLCTLITTYYITVLYYTYFSAYGTTTLSCAGPLIARSIGFGGSLSSIQSNDLGECHVAGARHIIRTRFLHGTTYRVLGHRGREANNRMVLYRVCTGWTLFWIISRVTTMQNSV